MSRRKLTNCQICAAPQIEEREETSVGTAVRVVCSRWLVHPIFLFGRRGKAGDPANAGVPR